MRTPIRIAAVAGVLALATLGGGAGATTGAIYDAIPSPRPSNLPSVGFQATQTAEFGDDIAFAAGDRNLQAVNVYMSSWACQAGSWELGDCATGAGATFTHPITLRLYAVSHVGGTLAGTPVLGAVLKTVSATFTIPYRPSVDPSCSVDGALATQWRDSAGVCKNGFGFVIRFNLGGFVAPDELVYGISYNTMSWGASPLGVTGGYDALNVGLAQHSGVGVDVNPDLVFWNTATAASYSDGGAAGTGTFRADTGWAGTGTVAAQFIAAPVGVATTTTVVAAGGPVPTTMASAVLAAEGALPGTGSSTSSWMILGGLLMLLGLALAMRARRPTKL
jgi:LPXTG-motif cell wall-anchored protein